LANENEPGFAKHLLRLSRISPEVINLPLILLGLKYKNHLIPSEINDIDTVLNDQFKVFINEISSKKGNQLEEHFLEMANIIKSSEISLPASYISELLPLLAKPFQSNSAAIGTLVMLQVSREVLEESRSQELAVKYNSIIQENSKKIEKAQN